jgi:hypothetical protein
MKPKASQASSSTKKWVSVQTRGSKGGQSESKSRREGPGESKGKGASSSAAKADCDCRRRASNVESLVDAVPRADCDCTRYRAETRWERKVTSSKRPNKDSALSALTLKDQHSALLRLSAPNARSHVARRSAPASVSSF